MSERHATLEVIAPTIEEAVSKGLAELGLPIDAVDVEILDEGSRGLFGIGSRQARVRLTIKDDQARPAEQETREAPKPPPEKKRPPVTTEVEEEPEPPGSAVEGEDPVLAISRETVNELLEKMKIRARVTAHYGEGDEQNRTPPVIVDVRGKDLSILIGRRAATLNALQYIARLIVGKELGRSVLLVVDVEGYRERRERQLRHLARRMADQALKTGRRQILEPMPANERRIIHIALREDPDVTTESIGEEPRRKVTIEPQQ